MNPYLEQPLVWKDFHDSYLVVLRKYLSAKVLPRYYVRVEENLYVRPPFREDETAFLGIADVELGKDRGTAMATAVVERTAAPVRVRTDELDLEEREVYLEVINRASEQLVTVIELLSPTNKEHPDGRAQYLKKRNALLASNTHLVEIDLSRGGRPMPVKTRPTATTVASSAECRNGPRETSGPSTCVSRCPRSPSPWPPATWKPNST